MEFFFCLSHLHHRTVVKIKKLLICSFTLGPSYKKMIVIYGFLSCMELVKTPFVLMATNLG